jgi:hypothetical protein
MLLLKTSDIRAVTGLAALMLSHWIGKGWIRPVRTGSCGRGLSYGFSVRQALGLCVVAAHHEVVGSASKLVRQSFPALNKVKEAEEQEALEWILMRPNAYMEELTAAAKARGEPVGPDIADGPLREALVSRLTKLHDLLKARCPLGADGRPLPTPTEVHSATL